MAITIKNGIRFMSGSTKQKIYELYYEQGKEAYAIARQLRQGVGYVRTVLDECKTKMRAVGLNPEEIYQAVRERVAAGLPAETTDIEGNIVLSSPQVPQISKEEQEAKNLKIRQEITEIFNKANSNFDLAFEVDYNKDSDAAFYLNVKVSEDAFKLMNNIVVKNLALTNYYYGENSRQRYKCKQWLYSDLGHQERDFLFDKELLEKKEMLLKFKSLSQATTFINNLKQSFTKMTEIIFKYNNLNTTVKCVIEKE